MLRYGHSFSYRGSRTEGSIMTETVKEKKNTIHELEFTIFCIESLAEALHQDGATVYQALSRGKNLIQNYIIPEYEVLHTQGKGYIVEELLKVMKDWGISL